MASLRLGTELVLARDKNGAPTVPTLVRISPDIEFHNPGRPSGGLNTSANHNVSAILSLEHEAMAARSRAERISDAVAGHAGRTRFIVAHFIWFILWIVLKSRLVPGFPVIDPYPYQFLTFVTSLEAIFLSLFILMSQNRSNR